jgi:FkbM family methyltransferase
MSFLSLKKLWNTRVKALLSHLQKSLGKRCFAVSVALKIRNQCSMIIKWHLGESTKAHENGEAWLAALVAPEALTFVDAGAHTGAWTDIFLESMKAPGKGLLFEPVEALATKLRSRFRDEDGIEVLNLALGFAPGEQVFFEAGGESQVSTLVEKASHSGALRKTISVTTVDIEVKKRKWDFVDFLKVDVEGYDLHVIRGASELLKSHRIGFIQFEYGNVWAQAGCTLAGCLDYLESFGYKVFLLKSSGLYELDYDRYGEYFGYSNFVAVSQQKYSAVETYITGRI